MLLRNMIELDTRGEGFMKDFWRGFIKEAVGFNIKHDFNPEQLSRLEDMLKNLSDDIKNMKNINVNLNEKDIDNIFSRVDKLRDPKKLILTGLALGGSLAGGALIGRALTNKIGRDVPIIGQEFTRGPGQPLPNVVHQQPSTTSIGRP